MTTLTRLCSLSLLSLTAACAAPNRDPLGGETDTDADPATGSTDDAAAPPDADDSDGGPLETSSTGSATGDGDESSGDGGPPVDACEDGRQCVGAVPAGWEGPVALLTSEAGASPRGCGGQFPNDLGLTLGTDFVDGGTPVCECSCSPADAECDLAGSLSYWDPTSSLTSCAGDPLGTFALSAGVTTSLPAPHWVDDYSGQWTVNSSLQSLTGTCEGTANAQIPAPSFSTQVTLCAPIDGTDTCDEGLCAPTTTAPFDGNLCIFREGEHTCDDPAYPLRSTYHTGYVDERECAACTCGDLQGSCSDEHYTVGYYDGDQLHWDNEQLPLDGSCETIALVGHPAQNAISAVAGDPVGTSCSAAPGSGTFSGMAQPADPVTVCCAG